MMKQKCTPKEALKNRMDASYKELQQVANKKVGEKGFNLTYALIGYNLGISGQTVGNYVEGKSKSGNGYLIDALIEEFNKLPDFKDIEGN